MNVALRHLLGKPDGYLIRWRCQILGHSWATCWDACCRGKVAWCARCESLESLKVGRLQSQILMHAHLDAEAHRNEQEKSA